jgi:hypothetical protein
LCAVWSHSEDPPEGGAETSATVADVLCAGGAQDADMRISVSDVSRHHNSAPGSEELTEVVYSRGLA